MVAVTVFLAVLGLIVAFFAWLHFSSQRVIRQWLETLAASPCPGCGTPYGIDVARRSQENYWAWCAREQERRPGYRINFARRWDVECPRCAARAQFWFEKNLLVPPLKE